VNKTCKTEYWNKIKDKKLSAYVFIYAFLKKFSRLTVLNKKWQCLLRTHNQLSIHLWNLVITVKCWPKLWRWWCI